MAREAGPVHVGRGQPAAEGLQVKDRIAHQPAAVAVQHLEQNDRV